MSIFQVTFLFHGIVIALLTKNSRHVVSVRACTTQSLEPSLGGTTTTTKPFIPKQVGVG
jgi:hypothetical protein